MDINRNKLTIVSLFMITICFWLLPLSVNAASRGITVKAKTLSGVVKEIKLYSGYHALVVGVSNYDKWPDLPNSTKDAQDVARTLKKMGFKVTIVTNPTSSELKKALNDMTYKYGRKSNRALLFYYAGYGETEKLADGTKLGYIIPKDCPLLKKDPIGFVNKAVSMKDIEAYSLRIRSKHVLMLFDSCFSGSLFSLVRAVPEDITEKSTLPVRQYITAGTEDETVPDRSMFKRCLLLGLEGDADLTRDGYITGTELGLYLSDKVIQNTRRAQHPQYGKIRTPELARGDFIFLLASSGVVIEKPAPKPSKAHLYVDTQPKYARVRILNIAPKFYQGMALNSGRYHVEVSAKDYESKSLWVELGAGEDKRLDISLNKTELREQAIEQPKSHGEVPRGWIGVGIQDISDKMTESYGLKNGVLVTETYPGGPSDLAGIKSKDIILSVNGKVINNARQLVGMIADTSVGDIIKVNVIRDGKTRTFKVKIGKREDAKTSGITPPERHGDVSRGWIGIGIQDINDEMAEYYGVKGKKGALVSEVFPGDPADEAGIKAKDIIIKVNGVKIIACQQLTRIIANFDVGEVIRLTILRNGI